MAGELIALEGDEIVMRFTADAAAFAFVNDPDPAYGPRPPVTDKTRWLRDVFAALTEEDEAGESLITRALDKAMHEAWQDGALGLDHNARGVGGTLKENGDA
jgi:hypothetical protein